MARNFLDLRPQVEPQIKIVEKIVLKGRVWYVESVKILTIIAIASGIVWGVSKADSVISSPNENFSVLATIASISPASLTLTGTTGSKYVNDSDTFDVTQVKKIQADDHSPLTLGDISVGDSVGVQGAVVSGVDEVYRIVDFTASTTNSDDNATSTASIATSTADDIASTTLGDIATTTDTSDATSSSPLSVISNLVGDAVQSIVNFFTGGSSTTTSSTATSSDDVSSGSLAATTSTPDAIAPDATSTVAATSSDQSITSSTTTLDSNNDIAPAPDATDTDSTVDTSSTDSSAPVTSDQSSDDASSTP